MKRLSHALMATLVVGTAVSVSVAAMACPAPGAAKIKVDDVIQEAYFLDRQGEFRQAIDMYKSVIQAYPDNRKAHYLLANCYWRDNQMMMSRIEWETVLRMDPSDRWGREARNWLEDNAGGGEATGAMAVTLAGGGSGYVDGPAKTAKFKWPSGLAVSGAGHLFVADTGNARLRKISPDGQVTTLAGDGMPGHMDGPAKAAKLTAPGALALDPVGNLYFADGNRVRFLTPTNLVGTLAGGTETGYQDGDYMTARFTKITALATDKWGNVWVGDGPKIRMISPQGKVSTVTGAEPGYADGSLGEARFKAISAMEPTEEGLIVVDAGNNRIRKIGKDGQVVSYINCAKVGYLDGPGASAHFGMLSGLAVGEDGSMFVSDAKNLAVRHISTKDEVVTVAGGTDEGTDNGRGIQARFMEPGAMVLKGRSLYVLDRKASTVRKIML